ncbi:MAG: ATP-binding protein [Pseudomonadota bacterium]
MREFRARIRETLTEVAEAAAAAEALCAEAGADEEQSLRIGLALDELAANALIHGALTEHAPFIEVKVWVEREQLHLTVEAEGPEFDPTNGPTTEIDPSAIGGRGISLVLGFADKIDYARVGERNVTRFSVSMYGEKA